MAASEGKLVSNSSQNLLAGIKDKLQENEVKIKPHYSDL
jgi:hypothetical protein